MWDISQAVWDKFGIFSMSVCFFLIGLTSLAVEITPIHAQDAPESVIVHLDPDAFASDSDKLLSLVEGVQVFLQDHNIEVMTTTDSAEDADIIGMNGDGDNIEFEISGTLDGAEPSTIEMQLAQISPVLTYTIEPVRLRYPALDASRQPELFVAAHILYALGRCDEALALFETMNVDDDSGDARSVNFIAGNCALLAGNYESAASHFQASIDAVHDHPEWRAEGATQNLSWLQITTGDTEAGITTYNTLFTDNFRDHFWTYRHRLMTRARLHALALDYDSAIADADRLIALEADDLNADSSTYSADKTRAASYTLRGEIILLIYEWDRALADFDTAIDLAPEYAPAHYQRGILLYTMADRENALASFERYLALAPDGDNAESAQSYIESIQTELAALSG